MRKNRKLVHVNLDEKVKDMLDSLAEERRMSKTTVVENLIIEAYEKKLTITEERLRKILDEYL